MRLKSNNTYPLKTKTPINENASIPVELSGMKILKMEIATKANKAANRNPPKKEKFRLDTVA